VAAEDGQKGSPQLGGVAGGFDQYEYVAVIIPGATLLFGALVALPGRLPWVFDKDFGLGGLGVFLVASFVTGQILRAVGDVAERAFWRCFGGQPTEWVLNNRRELLDDEQRKALMRRLKSLKWVDDDYSYYGSHRKKWQAITRQIYAKVLEAKRSARIDAFNRTLGMMNGVTIALAAIALLCWIKAARHAALWPPAISGPLALFPAAGALALILAGFTLYRFYSFGVLYGRELFVQFLELP
jgi:hypothetical protein